MKVLLNVYGGDSSDPFFQLLGLILMVVMIVLIVKQKKRKLKELTCEETTEDKEMIYVEKDVLGFDKTSRNYNESNYKPADKSKFKFIMVIAIFLVGLFLVLVYTPKKHGIYKGRVGSGVIHDPEISVQFGWWYPSYTFSRHDELTSKYDSLTSQFILDKKKIFEQEEHLEEKTEE